MSLRDRPFLELKVPLTWTAAVALIVAVVFGLAFLLSDRRQTLQTETYAATRNAVDTVSAPVSQAVAAPVHWTGSVLDYVRDYLLVAEQNRLLRQEVATLVWKRDRAVALENENARLRTLLGLKIDPPIPMVAARVIADSRGPFADSRLADAGRESGVSEGNPVISEQGMVGRILGVGQGVSRVLLLTDVASRTPVLVDRTNARAILTGDGGPNPKLAYLRGVDPLRVGDRILTSGDGGLFPRGLPIGIAVKGLDGAWRVRLSSDDAPIDYVRILLFKDFSQLANLKELATVAPPPLPPAQAAEIAAASMSTSPQPSSSQPLAHPDKFNAPVRGGGAKPPAHRRAARGVGEPDPRDAAYSPPASGGGAP